MVHVRIQLLGGFRVDVDGRTVEERAWRHRRGADLVKLLALAPAHRLPRERLIDALWPQLPPDAGLANVHKAAHFARRALGERTAVELRGGLVLLAPEAVVETDVELFEATGDVAHYHGDLLPDDRYESWAAGPRRRLRHAYLERLRTAGRWAELAEEEPADEHAQRELMGGLAEAGDSRGVVERFQALSAALAEVGLRPSVETFALYRRLTAEPPVSAPVAVGPPLVDREDELAEARARWRKAREGSGGAVLVAGDAGIGKTRLCEELLGEASAAGWTTLRGAAREPEGPIPYAPIMEALDRLVLERPDLVGQLPAAARAELSRLSVAVPGSPPAGGRPDRRRVFSAFGQLLAAAAREGGVLLLIDDVDLADDATLQVAHFLSRAARFQPLLVVLTFRDGSRPHLHRVRLSLLEQRLATEIVVGPLDRTAAESLVAAVATHEPASDTVHRIWELTAGNPFFTAELAASVRADGRVVVPDHLYEVVYARLAQLGSEVREALARAAIGGDRFTADEFVALGALAEGPALAALEAVLAAGVIEGLDDGYRFTHALYREALLRSLPLHRRAEIHREAADRLRLAGAYPALVAHHLIEAGSSAAAVPWLARAAREATDVAAYADALSLVELALPHASSEELRELLPLRADLLFATGNAGAAFAYGDAIARLGGRRASELRIKQARAALAAGELDAGVEALAGLSPRSRVDRARLASTRGLFAWFLGDLDEARRSADEARRLAIAAGLVQEAMEAVWLQAMIGHSAGEWRGRVAFEMEATATSSELSGLVFDAHLCVGEYMLASGEPYEAIVSAAESLLAAARKSGARRGEAFATTVLGTAELLTGKLEPAGAHLRGAVELNRDIGSTGGEALARTRLAEVALAEGRDDEAARLLEQAVEVARWSSLAPHVLFLVYEASLRAARDPMTGLALLDQAESLVDPNPWCVTCPIGFYAAAAITCARGGSIARARAFLAGVEGRIRALRGGAWIPTLEEARAEVALAEGRREEAALLLERSADGYGRAGQRLREQRVRASLATLA